MSTWFLCKATYLRTNEEGKQKKVVEELLFDAVSFTEAETKLYEAIGTDEDLQVTHITKTKIVKIIDDAVSRDWYKVNTQVTTLDDKTLKELVLVNAGSIQEVLNNFYSDNEYSSTDEITAINKTNILTVYTND
jgi:hypothetical protein